MDTFSERPDIPPVYSPEHFLRVYFSVEQQGAVQATANLCKFDLVTSTMPPKVILDERTRLLLLWDIVYLETQINPNDTLLRMKDCSKSSLLSQLEQLDLQLSTFPPAFTFEPAAIRRVLGPAVTFAQKRNGINAVHMQLMQTWLSQNYRPRQ